MNDLVRDLIPHAPQMGLYVGPDIPADKRRNALQDYADEMTPDEVLALYDATLMGNAKDGALFASDRFLALLGQRKGTRRQTSMPCAPPSTTCATEASSPRQITGACSPYSTSEYVPSHDRRIGSWSMHRCSKDVGFIASRVRRWRNRAVFSRLRTDDDASDCYLARCANHGFDRAAPTGGGTRSG